MMFLLVDFLLFDDRRSCVHMMVHDELNNHVKMTIGMHVKEVIAWVVSDREGGKERWSCARVPLRG